MIGTDYNMSIIRKGIKIDEKNLKLKVKNYCYGNLEREMMEEMEVILLA